jgi:hypothetical protein
MEINSESTAQRIHGIPKNEFSVEKIKVFLDKDMNLIKQNFKKKILIVLLDCINQNLSMSDAVVKINNLENGE